LEIRADSNFPIEKLFYLGRNLSLRRRCYSEAARPHADDLSAMDRGDYTKRALIAFPLLERCAYRKSEISRASRHDVQANAGFIENMLHRVYLMAKFFEH